jgi:hypothetical protein
MTTIIGRRVEVCQEVARKRDSANTLETHQYYSMLLDTAVADLMYIQSWHRREAKKRLRRMKAKRVL